MRVSEVCSCGARFQASGLTASQAAAIWRMTHPCPNGNGVRWQAEPVRESDCDKAAE
jgi:hypothetical protein